MRSEDVTRKFALWLLDVICVQASYLLANYIRFDGNLRIHQAEGFNWRIALVLVILVTVGNYFVAINHGFMKRSAFQELKVVMTYTVYLSAGLIVTVFALHLILALPRLVVLYFFVGCVCIMFVGRMLVKALAKRAYGLGIAQQMVVLVAPDGTLADAEAGLKLSSGYAVDGRVEIRDRLAHGRLHEDEIDCTTDDLADTLVPYRVDMVYIYTDGMPSENISTLTESLRDTGATVYLSLSMPGVDPSGLSVADFGETQVLAYKDYEPKPYQVAFKRAFDIFAALIGLILTGIISVVLVPAIKLDSPGPAIFAQTRVGKNGKRFKFYKFRSMYQDAEERKKALMAQNQVQGLMFKMDDDPRITKVGKFIRKTSLDEFPQFWNVLKGDMSIIGTRPPTVDEFEQYSGHYKRRLSIRPGITGLWQVSGRSNITDFDEVVKLDLKYIDNWSLAEDARILFKTVGVVLHGTGAE